MKVKKFPASIKSKATLRQVLTTLLWAFTGQHAATTYPILEYGGFVPNAPHRLFADSNGTATFSNLMFGNKAVALVSESDLICFNPFTPKFKTEGKFLKFISQFFKTQTAPV